MASYLKNCWYVAAYSRDVTRKPLARTLLGEPLVLYRTQGGDPTVLYDRCPHRFAPLSLGKLVGDEIECGYHGLRFSQAGNCTHNPHSSGIPKAARVRAYPTVERGGFIWYWPGDVERADRSLIPVFEFLDDPAHFSVVRGYLHVACSYQVVVDNLLDLSHTPFLHPQFRSDEVSAEAMLAATTSKLFREESRIFAYRLIEDLPVPAWRREAFGIKPGPVDTRLHMTWFPPALLYFDSGACRKGVPEREGFCAPAAHCIRRRPRRPVIIFMRPRAIVGSMIQSSIRCIRAFWKRRSSAKTSPCSPPCKREWVPRMIYLRFSPFFLRAMRRRCRCDGYLTA